MGAHWVALVGATPFKCVFVGVMPLSLLAPTFVSRQWRVKVREVLPSVHDVLRFRFCLGCRWNSLLRELDKQNDGVVGYASIVSTSLSFSFLHSCSSSRLWVTWHSPTPVFIDIDHLVSVMDAAYYPPSRSSLHYLHLVWWNLKELVSRKAPHTHLQSSFSPLEY